MIDDTDDIEDLDLALALRRLADASEPPPIDPRREAALMAAFDAARHARSRCDGPTGAWPDLRRRRRS